MNGPTEVVDRPPTREVVVAILLGTLGGFGIFFPYLGLSFRAMGVMGSGDGSGGIGPDFVSLLIGAALSVPLICLAATVAAAGLYRRARWGRLLGLVVAALLMAAPIVGAVSPLLPSILFPRYNDTDLDLVGLATHHLFTTGQPSGGRPIGEDLLLEPHLFVLAAIGALIVWGLVARPRAAATAAHKTPGRSVAPARRPRLALVLLVVLAGLSLGPYVAWLVGGLRSSPATDESAGVLSTRILTASAASMSPGGRGSGAPLLSGGPPVAVAGWDFGAGILVAVPSAVAAVLAILAARAIVTRAPIGPYLAPIAAAITGLWSALWLFVLGYSLAMSFGEGLPIAAVAAVLALMLLAVLAAASVVAVTVGVLRRRAWFRVPGSATPSQQWRRAGRRAWVAIATAVAVLLAPIGIGAATWTGTPQTPQDQLAFSDVLFEDRVYSLAVPVDVEVEDLTVAGKLSAWTEDLAIEVFEVLAFAEVPVERAIVVRLSGPDDVWPQALFVPSNDRSEGIPAELCRYVPLRDAGVAVEPCGPPWEVRFGDVRYEQIGEGGVFTVALTDLTPTGVKAEALQGAAAPDARIDLTARSIAGVPTSDAIALVVESRILLYKVVGRYGPGELCRVATTVVDPELIDKTGEDPMQSGLPGGCDFPSQVWLGETMYAHEPRDDQLLLVPQPALSVAGVAEVALPEFAPEGLDRQPFPPTIDATAYAIAGVSTADAIAFVVRDRVFVLRPNGGPLPAGLCSYVDIGYAQQLEAEGDEPVGCPATGS